MEPFNNLCEDMHLSVVIKIIHIISFKDRRKTNEFETKQKINLPCPINYRILGKTSHTHNWMQRVQKKAHLLYFVIC